MPGVSGVTVVTNACVYYQYTRGCGRIERPAFPAPSVFRERDVMAKLARKARRDREAVSARSCSPDERTRNPGAAVRLIPDFVPLIRATFTFPYLSDDRRYMTECRTADKTAVGEYGFARN